MRATQFHAVPRIDVRAVRRFAIVGDVPCRRPPRFTAPALDATPWRRRAIAAITVRRPSPLQLWINT